MGTKNLCAVLSIVAIGVACENREQPTEETVAQAPVESPSAVAEVKPEAEPPKPLEGAALANHYVSCWNRYNEKQWNEFGECYAEDATSTYIDSDRKELEGRSAIVETGAKEFTGAFSNSKGTPELVLVNGREIAAITLLTGTHDGTLKAPDGSEIAATNKQLGQRLVHFASFDQANQVKEERFVQDGGSMLSQLGLSDAPGRAAEVAPIAGAPNVVVAKNDATEQANVELIKQSWQNLQKEDLAALEAVLADDIVEADQVSPENLNGKQAVLDSTKTFLAAMGDIKTECSNVWGAGPYVVSSCRFQATNDGDMGKQFKKTGKPVDIQVVEVAKVEEGKLQEVWRFMNGTAFARQLGLLPPPTEKEVSGNADPAAPVAEAAEPAGAAAPPAGAPKPVEVPKDQPASGQK